MKKNTARIFALALAAVMLIMALAACGSAKTVEGTYYLSRVNTVDAKEVMTRAAEQAGKSLDDYLSSFGITDGDCGKLMTVTFNSDGTGKFEDKPDGLSFRTTWKQDGNKITVTTPDGEDLAFELNGDTVSYHNINGTFYFKKR